MKAAELRTTVQAPSTIKYRKEPPAPVKCDFSNKQIEYCVDIAVLVERCDRTGFMAAYYSGMRWELIPPEKQWLVSVDIRRFRKALREGGYPVD